MVVESKTQTVETPLPRLWGVSFFSYFFFLHTVCTLCCCILHHFIFFANVDCVLYQWCKEASSNSFFFNRRSLKIILQIVYSGPLWFITLHFHSSCLVCTEEKKIVPGIVLTFFSPLLLLWQSELFVHFIHAWQGEDFFIVFFFFCLWREIFFFCPPHPHHCFQKGERGRGGRVVV